MKEVGLGRIVMVIPLLALLACGGGPSGPEALPRLMETPDFRLTNSEGIEVSKASLDNRVWLVDFIFTRCGGPCPLMTQRLVSLQKALVQQGIITPDSAFTLVSITVDPAYDIPEVLKQYAEVWNADTSSWQFLTGPPESTLSLIREGFKIMAQPEGSGSEGGNILHSTSFLLVDRTGWVRRIVRLDDPAFVDSLVNDIRRLLNED